MKILTEDQAAYLSKQGWWKTKTPKEIARFQLEAQTLDAALGRSVQDIELRLPDRLLAELNGQPGPRSIGDILDTLPEEIRHNVIVVNFDKGEK